MDSIKQSIANHFPLFSLVRHRHGLPAMLGFGFGFAEQILNRFFGNPHALLARTRQTESRASQLLRRD